MANESTVSCAIIGTFEISAFWVDRLAMFLLVLFSESMFSFAFAAVLLLLSTLMYGFCFWERKNNEQHHQPTPSGSGPAYLTFWIERVGIVFIIFFGETAFSWYLTVCLFGLCNATHIMESLIDVAEQNLEQHVHKNICIARSSPSPSPSPSPNSKFGSQIGKSPELGLEDFQSRNPDVPSPLTNGSSNQPLLRIYSSETVKGGKGSASREELKGKKDKVEGNQKEEKVTCNKDKSGEVNDRMDEELQGTNKNSDGNNNGSSKEMRIEKAEPEVDREKEKATIEDKLKAVEVAREEKAVEVKRDEELKETDNNSHPSATSSGEEVKKGKQVEDEDNHEKEEAKIEFDLNCPIEELKEESACVKEDELQRLKARYDDLEIDTALWDEEFKKSREIYEEKLQKKLKKKKDKWEETLKKEKSKYEEDRRKWEEEKNDLAAKLFAATGWYQYYEGISHSYEESGRRWGEERNDLSAKLYAATASSEYHKAMLRVSEENHRKCKEEKTELAEKLCAETSSAEHFHGIMHEFEENCRTLMEEKNELIAKLRAVTESAEFYRSEFYKLQNLGY